MNKFFYFLAVGLVFTVLQVATVEADMIPGTDCAATPGGPEAVAACWDAQTAAHPCSGMTGDALITCTEENPPGSGESVGGGVPTLTLEDSQCQVAPADRDPGCPAMAGGAGHAGHAPVVPMCGDKPCPPPEDGAGEGCVAEETPALVAACRERNKPAPGDHPPGAHPPGDGGVALTIDDPRCKAAPEARDHRCPGFVAP